jgi:tellurite resistance protein
MPATISPHEALIFLMVMISASDSDMNDPELGGIGAMVRTLPVFNGFDVATLLDVARDCQQRLQGNNGMEAVLNDVQIALPTSLGETAYALAVEVAAADHRLEIEEARMLQIIRQRLRVDPLVATAIDRAAYARYRGLA